MALNSKKNSTSSMGSTSRHSAFRSHSQLLPIWQSISLTELVIADLNQKPKGQLSQAQLTEVDQRLALYFSLNRDEVSYQKLTQGLELQLFELECRARQVEFKLHVTGSLFSWAGLRWVDEWPEPQSMDQNHLYVQVSATRNLVFKSHNMAEPITVEIAGGISTEQQQDYLASKSDPVLLEALQIVRDSHIHSIVLNKAELEHLIDAQMKEILLSFVDTTTTHSTTPNAERHRRSALLNAALQESRAQLLHQLIDMPAAGRLAYLSDMETVSEQIDAERVEQAMRLGNHEAVVSDTQQAVMRSPQLARYSKDELSKAKTRLAKEIIDLKQFDDDQTILDKVIALKNVPLITAVLAYAEHLDVPADPEEGSKKSVAIETFSPSGMSMKQETSSSLLPKDYALRPGALQLDIDEDNLRMLEPAAEPLDEPPVKAWLIACALLGSNFDDTLRQLAQQGCLFDRVLMQQVCEAAPQALKGMTQAKIRSSGSFGGDSPASGGMPISDSNSRESSVAESESMRLVTVTLSELFDADYRVKPKYLASLLYPAKEGLSEAFVVELMTHYYSNTARWPDELWQAIQDRQAYNEREKEHFDILTQHCHKSLNHLTKRFLAHSGTQTKMKVWYEQKLKTELTLIHEAYNGQTHQSSPVDIRAALSEDPCLRARRTCISSYTLRSLPSSSPTTVSEVARLEQPTTTQQAQALLNSLASSAADRQRHAKAYFFAKQLFKKTLRHLDDLKVDNHVKKDTMLMLCDHIAKGKFDSAAALLDEVSRSDSPTYKILYARRDQQTAKPAKSYQYTQQDLHKRGELIRHMPALLEPVALSM